MKNKITKIVNQISSVCRVVGLLNGFYVWTLQFVAKRLHSQYLIDKKHNIIREYVKQTYADCVQSSELYSKVIPNFTTQKQHNIWVFWYQGTEGMPIIVRQCYDRLCKLNISSDCDVHLITKDNLTDYFSFPDYIVAP